MSDWLVKLVSDTDLNVRYTAVNCPVCWAYPGDACFRLRGGKPIRSRRKVPHFQRTLRYRKKIGIMT